MGKTWDNVIFWVNNIPLNVKEFHSLCNYDEERLTRQTHTHVLWTDKWGTDARHPPPPHADTDSW